MAKTFLIYRLPFFDNSQLRVLKEGNAFIEKYKKKQKKSIANQQITVSDR